MKPGLGLCMVLALTPTMVRGEGDSLAGKAKAILHRHCAGCHGGGKAVKGGFGFVLDRDRLVGRGLVMPGRAGESDLALRMQSGEMPPVSVKLRPSKAELDTLREWIDAGASAFEPAVVGKRLAPGDAIATILADLEALDPRRRRFTRYLTLTHFALAGRPASDLSNAREAVSKLLNSLSWHPRLTQPEIVDADGTILRIDLRSYKWSASAWEKLAAAYPYRLQNSSESKSLSNLTGTDTPALRGDWLVAQASRPPLYYDLLQLPTSDRALERLLAVEGVGDLQDDQVLRAGFNDSGVSKNNRLLQRHDAAYGAYWRSFDFATNTGRQNLFEHPLGPNAGATSFQPAGGEMIFHLPNGLLAYLLVDAKGQRIDKGPTEIVADPRRPDQRVEAGISCMSCHARGLLFKADQLRGHVEKNAAAFGKAVVETVRATHPRPAKFQAQIDEDNRRTLKALASFGVRDADQEPINLVTQRFEATLDGAAAAAELGLTIEELATYLQQNPDQTRLFGTLLVKGGTVQRGVFQDHFPEMSRRLMAARDSGAAKVKVPLTAPFIGHTGAVNSIAFASDGLQAASGGDDRTIRIWNVPSGQLRTSLPGESEIYAVVFSPDGKLLASGGRDRIVRVWDLSTRQPLRVFKGHTDSVRCLAFAPDGKRIVSGSDDRSLRIWDLHSDTEIDLVGHASGVTCVLWSAHGERILSGGRDGVARWWDGSKGRQLQALEGHAGAILSLDLSRDGKSALTGGNDQTVRLWNLANGNELHTFKGHASAVVQVRFVGDEIVSANSQHQTHEAFVRRWKLADNREIGTLAAGANDRFGCVAIAADGQRFLAGGPGGVVRFWSLLK